ncbi:MAG TPA: hypothetical protein VL588_01775, partial [Bdellovibrionota bacterium]|nr:hypothetical protein [Bdellovibrionota bacterium]
MKTKKTILATLATLALTSAPVLAADAAAPAKSVTTQQSVLSEMLSRTSIKWGGEVFGPAFSDVGTYQTDVNGAHNGNGTPTPNVLAMYHSAYVEYALGADKAYKLLVNPRFFASPFHEANYTGDNLRIGIKNAGIYKKGGFNLYAKLDTKLPTTDSAVKKELLTAPGWLLIGSYDFPKSKFSQEIWQFGRYNIYGPGAGTSEKALSNIGIASNTIYHLSPSFSMSQYFEISADSNVGTPFTYASTDDEFYSKTYFNWDVSSKVTLE